MCTMRVQGAAFDPEAWLAGQDALVPCVVNAPGHRLHDRRLERDPDAPRGFHVSVSDAPWEDWGAQVEDAISFLERHEAVLRALSGRADVDTPVLDFPCTANRDPVLIVADRVFPLRLGQAAARADVELEITVYVRGAEDPT